MTAKIDPQRWYKVPEAVAALDLPYRRGLRWLQRIDERAFDELNRKRILRDVSAVGSKKKTYTILGADLIAAIAAYGAPRVDEDVVHLVYDHTERLDDHEDAIASLVERVAAVESATVRAARKTG